jgi:CRISPR-associated protein TM1802 (cas_TM1802).
MPTNMKNLKIKLLPISAASAHKIRVGFLAVDKYLSHMLFYADKIGYYMAILPTVLAKDKTVFEKVIEKIRRIEKSNIEKIESGEYSINRFLEKVAKEESGMPVLNTILFYSKSNASINMLLQIDDVLPSFIANTSKQMSNFDISAFSPHNNQNVIFVEKLFNNKIEVIKFLLSRNKFDTDIMINKYYRLLYNGKNFINWASCFNGFRIQYGIDTIKRYQMLFNKLNILTKKIIFQKEFSVEEVEKIKDMKKEEIIKFLLNSTDFIKEDDVLNSAYLLGMMSAGLVNWQYALYKGTAFEKWLNNSGAITKESLDRIYAKSSCVYKTLKDVAGNDNKTIQYIDYCLLERLPKAIMSKEPKKNSYLTIAFAMGGRDFNIFLKNSNTKTNKQQGDEE